MRLPPAQQYPHAPGQRLRVACLLDELHEVGRDDLADDVVVILRERISNERARDAIAVKLSADARWEQRIPSTGAVRMWRKRFADLNDDWRAPINTEAIA